MAATVTKLVNYSPPVQEPDIEIECFMYCLKRIQNWVVPGPDGIQGFWV